MSTENLKFRLVDCNNSPIVNRKIVVTPTASPRITSSYLSVHDSQTFTTNASGSITASVVSGFYFASLANPKPETEFYISATESGSNLISGSIKSGVTQSVVFNLVEFDLDVFSTKKVILTPQDNYPSMFSGSLVMLASTSSVTDSSGSVTFSSLIPGVYRADAIGKVTTAMYISVPTNGVGQLNAKDLLVVTPAKGIKVKLNGADNSYVPTIATADARYMAIGQPTESSSYALTASFALNGGGSGGTSLTTGSTYPITASWSNTASYMLNGTASNTHFLGPINVGQSLGSIGNDALLMVDADGNMDFLSVTAQEASYLSGSTSNIQVQLNSKQPLLNGNFAGSSSYALTASYALNGGGSGGTTLSTGSTYPITASWSNNTVSASYVNGNVLTSNITASNGLTVSTGNITLTTSGSLKLNTVKLAYGVSALSNYFFGDSGNPTVANMVGSNNQSVGAGALFALTSGNENVAMGVNSLGQVTSGVNNIGLGRNGGFGVVGGNDNIAIGERTLETANSSNAVGIGKRALQKLNGSLSGEVAVGYFAAANTTTGIGNTALGGTSLTTNTTGSFNMSIGYQSLSNIVGNRNTAIGAIAWGNASGGDDNIAIGYNAASNQTSGNGNLIIGSGLGGNPIQLPSTNGSNQMNIMNVIYGTGLTGTGTTSAGNIGIGTNAPGAKLEIADSANARVLMTQGGGNKGYIEGNTGGLQIRGLNSNDVIVSNTANTTLATFANSTNVGIGAVTPIHKLHVFDSSTGNLPNIVADNGSSLTGINTIGFYANNIFDGGMKHDKATKTITLGTSGSNSAISILNNGQTTIATLTGSLFGTASTSSYAGYAASAGNANYAATLNEDLNYDVNNIRRKVSSVGYSATRSLDFDGDGVHTMTLTGNVRFETNNRTAGREKSITYVLTGDSVGRNLYFEDSWNWLISMPVTCSANVKSWLTLSCIGANSSSVYAAYKECV